MLLYHGSTVVVEKPRLVQQNRYLDFGFGFYTASNLIQIKQFAKKVSERRGGLPIVNVYEIDETDMKKQLKVKTFSKPDGNWLDFVAQNRTGAYSGPQYDLIIGPVANDDVYQTVYLYLLGVITKSQTLKALKVKQLLDQYVFTTDKALSLLKFIKTEEI